MTEVKPDDPLSRTKQVSILSLHILYTNLYLCRKDIDPQDHTVLFQVSFPVITYLSQPNPVQLVTMMQ